MKQVNDYFTGDLLGNRPGRPRDPNAKPGAQRQREYRQRKAQKVSVTSDENKLCAWCGVARSNSCGLCNVGQLGHV
jgi:hypothetical protein